MEIKYKNKPNLELVDKYRQKLEHFLSAHNVSISIEVWDNPLRIESYINNRLVEIENHWIRETRVSSSKLGELSVHLISDGIDENIDIRKAWNDAWDIQNQIYGHLKLY